MIFLHLILGLILGSLYGNTLFFVLASMFPDIDHLYLIIKHRIYPIKRTIHILKKEEAHGIHFKTPIMHSLFGLIICSLLFLLVTQNMQFTSYFSLLYCSHLLLDWPDIDKKQYLYPFSRREFRGKLPIWSKAEQLVTLLAVFVLGILYLN